MCTNPNTDSDSYLTPTVTNTVTPTLTPTITTTPTLTLTSTITPTPTSSSIVGGLTSKVSYSSSFPSPGTSLSGTVWYSYSAVVDGTQPYPTGFTWTQLGSVMSLVQCLNYVNFGNITIPSSNILYVQIRDESGTNIYLTDFNQLVFNDPCSVSLGQKYTQNFYVGSGTIADTKYVVSYPLTTAAAP